jgi:hypothetical protein
MFKCLASSLAGLICDENKFLGGKDPFYRLQAVVPSVAWDFLFDKHLPYQTYLTNLLNFSLLTFNEKKI